MRLKSGILSLLAALVIVGAVAPDADASHFRYGTMSWAPTGIPGEVRIDLRVAFRRNGLPGPPSTGAIFTDTIGQTRLAFGDGMTTPILQFRATDFSATEDWVVAVALNPGTNDPGITHTYAAGSFTANLINGSGAVACCRLSTVAPNGLNNRADASYPLQTNIDAFSGNSSPVSNLVPIVVTPRSNTATFLLPASDPDGDALRFRVAVVPTESGSGGSTSINHPPNISIDPNTGVVTWNNNTPALDATRFWTMQFMVEDLDASGNVKTKTPVDFLLKIVPQQGQPPSCAINPAGPFTVEPGDPVTFVVTGTDPDPGNLILNSSGVPSGATMTPSLPRTGPSPVSSTFNWTPTAVGSTVISYSVTDPAGNQALCSATIDVIEPNQAPTISCPAAVTIPCAGPGGTPHTLTVHVEDGDGDALVVTWDVNGSTVQTDNVPAGTPTTSADVDMTRNYPVGATPVTVTVNDGQNADGAMRRNRLTRATASCTTTVTVVDNTPPTVVCNVAQQLLWPPNHNMVNVGLVATATDACTGASGPAGVSVFGDEDDDDDTGDGRHSPDAMAIANGTLLLRSEREGDKDGRVYLIRGLSTDGNNSGHACCAVVVPQNMSPKSQQDVQEQAAAAVAVCNATGAAPAGFFVVGDGPVLGPKQGTRFSNGTPVQGGQTVRARGQANKTEGTARQRNRQ